MFVTVAAGRTTRSLAPTNSAPRVGDQKKGITDEKNSSDCCSGDRARGRFCYCPGGGARPAWGCCSPSCRCCRCSHGGRGCLRLRAGIWLLLWARPGVLRRAGLLRWIGPTLRLVIGITRARGKNSAIRVRGVSVRIYARNLRRLPNPLPCEGRRAGEVIDHRSCLNLNSSRFSPSVQALSRKRTAAGATAPSHPDPAGLAFALHSRILCTAKLG
jgi:hypothetical protein